jgi:hypothetical protein
MIHEASKHCLLPCKTGLDLVWLWIKLDEKIGMARFLGRCWVLVSVRGHPMVAAQDRVSLAKCSSLHRSIGGVRASPAGVPSKDLRSWIGNRAQPYAPKTFSVRRGLIQCTTLQGYFNIDAS